jgi:hypothetical protein
MIANIQRAGVLFIIILLLSPIESYSKEESVEKDTNMVSVQASTLAGDSAISDSSSEPKNATHSSLFFPIDELHEVIREERVDSLVEIDKQRKETLVYLTQERKAILDEMRSELKRITELIDSERTATMVELHEIGNLVAENAILNSKQLIDHLFIRMLQFVAIMIIALIIFALIIYGIIAKKKKNS